MVQKQNNQYEQLINSIHQIDLNLQSQILSTKCILLMGQTKAGKTTLFYYLLAKKLILSKNNIDVYQLIPQVNYLNAIVGDGYQSTTVYPNISPSYSQHEVMLIDMPGFHDSRFDFRLLNVYILLRTLKLLKRVHICNIISQQLIDGDSLIEQLKRIYKLFNRNILQSNNISFILSKIQRQNIRQYFIQQIDQIINLDYIQQYRQSMQQFRYKNPQLQQQGLQLKNKIQNENQFYQINQQPHLLLSTNYALELIGNHQIQLFQEYLIQIIHHIHIRLIPLIQIYKIIVFLEFHHIFDIIQYQSIDIPQYIYKLNENGRIVVDNMPQLSGEIMNFKRQLNEQYFILLIDILNRAQIVRQNKLQYLILTINQFSINIGNIKTNNPILGQSYLHIIQYNLKGMGSLIEIINQIKIQTIINNINQLISQQMLNHIQQYYNIWQNNSNKIMSSSQFKIYSSNQKIKDILLKYNIEDNNQQQIIIKKIFKYSIPIYDKQIKKIINKKYYSKQKHKQIYTQNLINLSDDQFIDVVNQLTHSPQSLKYLIIHFKLIKKDNNIWKIKYIINKISDIFYSFSFFEQAIMFKMSIPDQIGLQDLLDEAICCEELSEEFMREILIPYFEYINMDRDRLYKCYNYLINLMDDVDDKLSIEQQLIRSLSNIEMNGIIQYMNLYKELEFYYIDYIMQNFEYYLQIIYKKQQYYMRSNIIQLMSFINIKMKQ